MIIGCAACTRPRCSGPVARGKKEEEDAEEITPTHCERLVFSLFFFLSFLSFGGGNLEWPRWEATRVAESRSGCADRARVATCADLGFWGVFSDGF